MAIYAVGDIQGCYDALQRLLERLGFDPVRDRLWLTGDLVNRGPKSLEVLRFVKALGESAVTVLGNHDLHLLALWRNREKHAHPSDTLQPVLQAPDRDDLLEWLRCRPLLHHDARIGYTMVHAGLPPQWDLIQAQACAREVEEVLRGPQFEEFLEHMYGNKPRQWSAALSGWDRLRFSVNCFTRLRFCTREGILDFARKGPPGNQDDGFLPWFQVPSRRSADLRLIFGHWSTLGLYIGGGAFGLDTGCLWGGSLTALTLANGEHSLTHVDCGGVLTPGQA